MNEILRLKLKHKEWRKVAKRERRRRIRTQQAKIRDKDKAEYENTSDYLMWKEEQDKLDNMVYEQIEMSNMEENRKWQEAEEIAMNVWNVIQAKKKLLHDQHLQREAKRRLEWEMEQKHKKEEEEKLKKIEEEKRKQQELFMSNLELFLSGDSIEPPAELNSSRASKPDREPCPFFTKTACCRFGDHCSRNHEYPGISKVLLAQNFFTHFGLDNTTPNEYDTDLMLEYEDSDTYKQFLDFFYDVLPEFEKFGVITQFKVCHNYEKHLRGNTYIEYAELRCAVAAYRHLHSRWYGGKQLSLQFCHIDSWTGAICGLASTNRCPKGQSCNYLHVFRNPNNLFNNYRLDRHRESIKRTPSRNWRWSESPERHSERRRRSKSPDRKYRKESKKKSVRYRSRRKKSSETEN